MTTKRTRAAVVVVLLAFLMFAPGAAFAQAVYGSIFGTVTDPSGAAVPNAKVTITSITKGTKNDTTTNPTGNYTVTHLIPDLYDVRVESPGFKVGETKEVRVFADQGARVDTQLQLGTEAQSVTVTAEDIPLLKTDRADVATTFTNKALTELPVISRNFTEFELLTPGTQTMTWQHAASENLQRSIQINIGGQHFSGTSWQLDGTENRDPILGIIVINPILDSITEAKIVTQAYDAEFGQAEAAVITAQTKSGSNSLHGSAYLFRRNDELQARDPFNESKKDPITGKFKPDALWDQFGGTAGFPLVKNKLFFFGGYQGTREKVGRSATLTVPTNLVRTTCLNPNSNICDMSEYLSAGRIFDPASPGTLFAGNIIPKGRISPQSIALLSLLPAPTGGGTSGNYTASGTGGFNDNSFTTRVDYNMTDKLHVFGRYSFFQALLTGKGAFDTASVAVGGRGLGLNGFAGNSNGRNQSLSAGFDYSVSNKWLTDVRFGYFKYRVIVAPNGLGTSPATDAGIPGLNLDNFFTSGMPAFFIGDQGQPGGDIEFGYALSDRLTRCNCPLREVEDQFQVVNNWTRVSGNHNFKFGADIRYARNLRVPSDQHRAGELSFAKTRTANGGTSTDGVPLATFLLGDVTTFRRYPPNSPTDAGERQKRWFFYGQDTWRATPKLTINYGLRWEIYFPENVTGDAKGGNLNLETGNIMVAGVGDISRSMNIENSLRNWAPRLGIAYQVTPKTVLRMGYGRSFDIGVFGSVFGHVVTQNIPVLVAQNLNAANQFADVFSLAQGPPAPPNPEIPSNGLIQLPDGVFARSRPNRMQVPTLDAWNLTIQRQITPTLSAEIGYVGNKGTHVFVSNNPDLQVNQATIEGFLQGIPTSQRKLFYHAFPFQTVDASGACTATNAAGESLCWNQDIASYGNVGSSNYHSLQAKIDKRFSKGYQFTAHYTWSQAFNFDTSYFPIDPRVSYGPNDFTRRHVFVFTNLWELPFGRGKTFGHDVSRAVDHIIGGWQINTVTNWSGGLPFTPGLSSCANISDTGPCRPSILKELSTGDAHASASYVCGDNCPSYYPVGLGEFWALPAPGTFGTAKRNSMRGPTFFNTDASVFKNFVITERVRAQFRAEFTNVFNHMNMGTPGVFWSEFGFGGSTCVNCGDPITITSLGGRVRQAQFGLRLTF